MGQSQTHRTWTVAEAKARLSEILRLAEAEGPQHIGARKSFFVVPADAWYSKQPPRKPLGQWLIENTPRGINLEIPGIANPGGRYRSLTASLHFSPRGEAKWVRGPSGRGARRLARAGVLEPYVEHGKQ